jgi:hypothetical protein
MKGNARPGGPRVTRSDHPHIKHASAAMTLDVYADLFDDDLDAVAVALDHAASLASVGKKCGHEVPVLDSPPTGWYP